MLPHRVLLLVLAVLTVAAYWGVGECGFVGYDDPSYVRDNPMVNQGLRPAAILWACTATHSANWHPLTSLSHMLDCTLFDLHPAPPHWVNLGWHVLNTALVFLLWRTMTAALWRSALVAGLFALHPLHVESVAWISERKDVLSTALWLLTIGAYVRWVRRPSTGGYALVALGLALGLMAKAMVVTLPCTLLLLDYWPLRRWPERRWRALLWEKGPLFGLTLASSIVTALVQRDFGAAAYGERFTLAMRLGNALISYARYLGKTFWPQTLSPFYPHPGGWPWGAVLGAGALVAAVSWLVWREREGRRWLVFGWGWYLGTLVPVIGLVQVGAQSMADRYTNVPLLGIFTMVVWAGGEIAERRPRLRIQLGAVAALALAACFARTAAQVSVWRTARGLIEHMRAAIGEHEVVYREFAMATIVEGRPEEEVMAHYRRGLEVAPESTFCLIELGANAADHGRFDEARALLGRALTLLPRDAGARHNFASACKKEGKLEEALRYVNEAIALDPNLPDPRRLQAEIFVQQGRIEAARDALLEAVRGDRWDALAFNELGTANFTLGRYSEAVASLERALWIDPRDETVRENLRLARTKAGRPER